MKNIEDKDEVVLLIKGVSVLILSLVSFAASIIRGTDYANGDSIFTARRLGAVENAAPLWFWGIAFCAVGCAGMIFIMLRIWSAVVASHILAGGLYATISAGFFLDAASRVGTHTMSVSPIMAFPVAVFLLAFVQLCMGKPHSGVIFLFSAISLGLSLLTVPFDGIRSVMLLLSLAATHLIIAINIAENKARYECLESKLRGE